MTERIFTDENGNLLLRGAGFAMPIASVTNGVAVPDVSSVIAGATDEFQMYTEAVAAGSSVQVPLIRTAFALTVTAAWYVPTSSITGNDAGFRTIAINARSASGGVSTVVATLAFVSGVNTGARVQKAIPLTLTIEDRDVAAARILSFESTTGGTGLADPGGLVIIEFDRA